MRQEWSVRARGKIPACLQKYPPAIASLLAQRGIKTKPQLEGFLCPDFEKDLHDPFLLLGMNRAVARIKKAIIRKEPITLFGDYDADGVSGTAILEAVLRRAGTVIKSIYIPDRHQEGYGLNETAVRQIAKGGSKLIITIDCGITDVAEVKLAQALGVEVVITDHHHVWPKVPKAVAIVNPHQPKDRYPFKELSGAGVAFKLGQALLADLEVPGYLNFLKWQLDLVALATVADCVSLLGENRTLVKYGLLVLAQTRRFGLRELLRVAGIKPVCDVQNLCTNLDSFALGFMLAPRINAAGRMEHANTAYDLLVTESENEARWLAQRLDDKNKERQSETEKLIRQTESGLKNLKKAALIFAGGANYASGILGLVAGRLADRYFKPAFIFGQDGELVKGSARAPEGFNLIAALEKSKALFVEFGGHPRAAGFVLRQENLGRLEEALNKAMRQQAAQLPPPVLCIDVELELADRKKLADVWHFLEKCAPFGQDNEEPVFLSKNLMVKNSRNVGNGEGHLKLDLANQKGDIFPAIGFGLAPRAAEAPIGSQLDVVYKILPDEWNGEKRLSLKLVDFKVI